MMKRLFSALLSMVLSCALLAGCSGVANSASGATTDGEGQKTKVSFMVGGSAGELDGYKKAVEAFNAQSSTVQVELVGLPGEGYNEKLITQLNSKTPPDCFYSEEATFGELNNSDALLDLTPYLDAGAYGLAKADIPASLLEFCTMNGKTTGVPVDSNPMVLYYNAELFQEKGMKSPQEYVDEGTWNFAALQQVSEQFQQEDIIGFVYENWWGPLYTLMLSADTELYAADGKTSNFDDPRMKAGLTYLKTNVDSGAFKFTRNSEQANSESPDKLFMSGQSAMIYAGRWFVPDFVDIGFAWDVVPFPYYEKPEDLIAPVPSTPMVINKATHNPEAVWEFVSFYCGAPGQEERTKDAGNAVPTVPGLEEITLTGTPAHAQYFLDALEKSFSYPRVEATHPGLTDDLADEIEKMLVGDQDVDTTLAAMKAMADKALAE